MRSWLRRGGARGRAALIAAMVLLAFGAAAIGWVATHQTRAPEPAASAAGSITAVSAPTPTASSSSGQPGARKAVAQIVGPTLAPSIPQVLAIPAISVRSPLLSLGKNPDGSLQVPQPGPHYNEAAWYNGLRTPGELGPAIILGHIDSAAEGPSVFFRLGALHIGDRIYVTRADGKVAVFAVNAVRSYPKASFPNDLVYAATPDASLRLITCGGDFDRSTGSYLSNVVVFAHLLKAQPAAVPMPAR